MEFWHDQLLITRIFRQNKSFTLANFSLKFKQKLLKDK